MHPRNLGRYEIIRELGRGGMGRVFLAHDFEIDRNVAVKVVDFASLTSSREEEARQGILAEARAAGRLLHPSIVALFDVGETDEGLFLAMEYVEGTTLDAYCSPPKRLEVETVVELVAGVADALDYAHEAGVVHRDIKPANVMRVGDTAIKVMDFGLARPAEQQHSLGGSLIGTPAYMSPEQIRGDKVDGRGDLFSLTVVLYELLSGARPFEGASVSSVIYRVVHEPPNALVDGEGRIPAGLRRFVERGLSKNPDQRIGTGAEYARALRESVRGARAVLGTPPTDAATPADAVDAADAADAVDAVDAESGPSAARPEPPKVRRPESEPEPAAPSPAPGRPQRSGATRTTAAPSRPPAKGTRRPRKSRRSTPFVAGLVALVLVLAAAAWTLRDRLGIDWSPAPREVWWQATVRTEPAGLPVLLDGEPLEGEADGAGGVVLRFLSTGPFGVLTTSEGCREARHELGPQDAAAEIVLVVDPAVLAWRMDGGVEGATVSLNDDEIGTTPAAMELDLCRENRVELARDGYRPAAVELPAGVTPLEARTTLSGLSLEPIPTATVRLPVFREMKLIYYVDGRRLPESERELELTEGSHEVRYKNEYFWIDERRRFEVRGGEAADAPVDLPVLTTLVVQAYPSNCKVHVRRPGGRYRAVDETPLRKKLAVGEYDVRVVHNSTGAEKVERVNLVPGDNPPLRVSFRSGE